MVYLPTFTFKMEKRNLLLRNKGRISAGWDFEGLKVLGEMLRNVLYICARFSPFKMFRYRLGNFHLQNSYFVELRCLPGWIEDLAVDLKARRDSSRLQLSKGDITPLAHFNVIVQDGIAEEEILSVVFRDEPVASTNKEVEVDGVLSERHVLGFIESGNSGQML